MRGTISVVGKNKYLIAIESMSPSVPPYRRNTNGDVIVGDDNEPILQNFTNFIIEGQSEASKNVNDIGSDLVGISNDLKGFDFITVENSLKAVPNSFPGVRALKKAMRDINNEIEDIQKRTSKGASSIADSAQAAGAVESV